MPKAVWFEAKAGDPEVYDDVTLALRDKSLIQADADISDIRSINTLIVLDARQMLLASVNRVKYGAHEAIVRAKVSASGASALHLR